MAFKQLLPLQNLNFQMNRVLTHGEKACREEELSLVTVGNDRI